MTTPRTHLTERWHWLVIIVLAAVPVITMAMYVLRASPMQWNDYWDVLPRVTNPDGSFSPRGALTFQNEHPVALPGFIFWANAKVAGGSNNVLGLYVVAVGIATLVVLVRALPADIKADRALRGTFVVVFAALLFAPRGIDNFVLAMTGTFWLTSNVLACIAILVAWRWNAYAALPLAALAALSLGTGLATFPVLVLMAVLQQRPRRVVGILAAATVLAGGLYLSQHESPPWVPGTSKTVVDVLRRSLQVLGAPFVHDLEVAGLVGVMLPCLAGVAIAAAHRQGRLAELAPWIGVLAYGIAGSLLIGWSRGGLPDEAAISGRYVSVAVLAWAATFVLGAATLGRSPDSGASARGSGPHRVRLRPEGRDHRRRHPVLLGRARHRASHRRGAQRERHALLDHGHPDDCASSTTTRSTTTSTWTAGCSGSRSTPTRSTGPSRSKRPGSTAGWRRSATGASRTPRRSTVG